LETAKQSKVNIVFLRQYCAKVLLVLET